MMGSGFEQAVQRSKQRLRSSLAHHPALKNLAKMPIAIMRRVLAIPHEDDFRLLAALQLAEGETIIDIGANHGQSIRSIRLFQSGAPIVAFEPNPILAQKLERTFEDDHATSIVNAGLAAQPGRLVLRIPIYGSTTYDGIASFASEPTSRTAIAEEIAGFDASKLTYREVECPVERLDDRALTAGFVKIDVEGYEAEVLSGALATLQRCKPVLLIEDGGRAAIRALLEPLGYRPFAHRRGRLVTDGVDAGRNTWFIHPEAPRGMREKSSG